MVHKYSQKFSKNYALDYQRRRYQFGFTDVIFPCINIYFQVKHGQVDRIKDASGTAASTSTYGPISQRVDWCIMALEFLALNRCYL